MHIYTWRSDEHDIGTSVYRTQFVCFPDETRFRRVRRKRIFFSVSRGNDRTLQKKHVLRTRARVCVCAYLSEWVPGAKKAPGDESAQTYGNTRTYLRCACVSYYVIVSYVLCTTLCALHMTKSKSLVRTVRRVRTTRNVYTRFNRRRRRLPFFFFFPICVYLFFFNSVGDFFFIIIIYFSLSLTKRRRRTALFRWLAIIARAAYFSRPIRFPFLRAHAVYTHDVMYRVNGV